MAAQPGQVPVPAPTVSWAEYEQRLEGLRREMERSGVDVAVIYYSRDLLYYSGTALYCILIVPLARPPVLLARINTSRARAETWVQDVRDSAGPDDIRAVVAEVGLERGVVGIEEEVTTVNFYRKLVGLLPGARFHDIGPAIVRQRVVKSPTEVELVRRAASISAVGLGQARATLCAPATEVEVAAEVEVAKRRAGHDGVMVYRRSGSVSGACFVMSGPNLAVVSGYWISIVGSGSSPALPYGASYRRIEAGDLVDVNHGTMFHGYHADEGKMFVVGRATEKQRKLFDVVRRAQDAAIARVKPGVRVADVYLAARSVVEQEGCLDYFQAFAQYGVEYLGHGVGLEIDEPPLVGPSSQTVLREGMTLALEPKLVIPGWGGVDIEDTLVVTREGCELLTQWPRELLEVAR